MEEKWMELEERKVLKQSSDSSFRSSRAPQDGNRQQAEQAATGNRQHGLSSAGLGNSGRVDIEVNQASISKTRH